MKKMPKNANIFLCEKCDFKCSKKSNYDTHLLTSKHKNRTLLNNFEQTIQDKFKCDICEKTYCARNSFWYHKKKCKIVENAKNAKKMPEKKEELFNKDNLIQYLIKENKEFKELIVEQTNMVMKIYEKGFPSINNSNINSHNKTFNLQLFLNETCKDAMNITDFVDSIKLQLSDLENVGKVGYVEGISNIIVENLKALDVSERPIHCTDKKREVLYVKDADKWEKEDEEKKKLRKVIKNVANKNIRLLQKFKEAHPDCGKSSSKFSDQYDKIIVEAMGGSGDNDFEKEEKIIQKISKNVTIDKDVSI